MKNICRMITHKPIMFMLTNALWCNAVTDALCMKISVVACGRVQQDYLLSVPCIVIAILLASFILQEKAIIVLVATCILVSHIPCGRANEDCWLGALCLAFMMIKIIIKYQERNLPCRGGQDHVTRVNFKGDNTWLLHLMDVPYNEASKTDGNSKPELMWQQKKGKAEDWRKDSCNESHKQRLDIIVVALFKPKCCLWHYLPHCGGILKDYRRNLESDSIEI